MKLAVCPLVWVLTVTASALPDAWAAELRLAASGGAAIRIRQIH